MELHEQFEALISNICNIQLDNEWNQKIVWTSRIWQQKEFDVSLKSLEYSSANNSPNSPMSVSAPCPQSYLQRSVSTDQQEGLWFRHLIFFLKNIEYWQVRERTWISPPYSSRTLSKSITKSRGLYLSTMCLVYTLLGSSWQEGPPSNASSFIRSR